MAAEAAGLAVVTAEKAAVHVIVSEMKRSRQAAAKAAVLVGICTCCNEHKGRRVGAIINRTEGCKMTE